MYLNKLTYGVFSLLISMIIFTCLGNGKIKSRDYLKVAGTTVLIFVAILGLEMRFNNKVREHYENQDDDAEENTDDDEDDDSNEVTGTEGDDGAPIDRDNEETTGTKTYEKQKKLIEKRDQEQDFTSFFKNLMNQTDDSTDDESEEKSQKTSQKKHKKASQKNKQTDDDEYHTEQDDSATKRPDTAQYQFAKDMPIKIDITCNSNMKENRYPDERPTKKNDTEIESTSVYTFDNCLEPYEKTKDQNTKKELANIQKEIGYLRQILQSTQGRHSGSYFATPYGAVKDHPKGHQL